MIDRWVFLLVTAPLLMLWVASVVEVFRRRDLSGPRTALWLVALLLVPLVSIAVYVVARPPRAVENGRARADTSRAEALVVLAERRQRGEISDEDYVTSVASTAPTS